MADCTIIDKLNYILETKDLIRTAIETQDVEVLESDTFRKYSEYITEIRKVASINGQTGDIILKTINGQDLVGEGDITIEGGSGETIDLSNYYTKEEINSLIPTIFVQKIIEYTNKLVIYDQDGQASELNFATINGNNILGNSGDITIEGGTSSGVESIDVGGVYLTGKLSISNSTESSDNSWRVSLNGGLYDSTTDEYYGEGGSMIFGVKSSDNSILVSDGGSLADLVINPDILSGASSGDVDLSNYYTKDETYSKEEVDALIPSGSTGVEAINIGTTIQDWTQKTGIVSFYTDFYDGSYDVAIGGTSFYGLKPVDDSILIENGGGTVNGNFRCGIKVNPDNFKTINGESIIGSGDITISGGEGGSGTINIVELTKDEYDALTEYADNTFYVITDVEKQYTTLEEVEQQGYLKEIPDTYVTDEELSTATSDKVSQTALNEAIQGVEAKFPTDYIYQLYIDYDDNTRLHKVYKSGYGEYINFKTINGETILGSGDITIEVGSDTTDLSNYYTKEEIDALIGGVSDKISEINSMI